jgi:flagellar basal body-associated protein FliL
MVICTVAEVLVMHKHILRSITVLAALSVSGLAVALAWASAQQRATTAHDQLLLAALSVSVVLAVHMLPALLRRRHPLVLWPVWVLCLALAGYGHASWFYRSAESAAEARHAGSAAVAAVARERSDIEQTLSTIKARPVAQVAAQLARTTDEARREALTAELAEAKRTASLRDRLILLSRNTSGTGQEQSGAPGNGSGTVQERDVTLVMSVAAALLLEVLGALLWSVALAGDDDADQAARARAEPAPTVVQQVVNFMAPVMPRPVHDGTVEVVDELADVRAAIARGECRESVRSIREYVGCSMERASHLRRQLISQ